MWSGKWAVVTPHAVLNAVWRLIPAFHGYTQQDAQEFMCEVLECLQSELEQVPTGISVVIETPSRVVALPQEILPDLFQGRLASKVTYARCRHSSVMEEPFWDLSLELPDRCSEGSSKKSASTREHRSVYDLLHHFTATETLEGQVYVCDKCAAHLRKPQAAYKQFMISSPPDVLKLHLKRFRWRGVVREKLGEHISFPLSLDISRYCTSILLQGSAQDDVGVAHEVEPTDYLYDLVSVIVHHGTGFSSGHYTACCWNSEGDSWVQYNDARVGRCSQQDLLQLQAYILIYARRHGCSPANHHSSSTTTDDHSNTDNKTSFANTSNATTTATRPTVNASIIPAAATTVAMTMTTTALCGGGARGGGGGRVNDKGLSSQELLCAVPPECFVESSGGSAGSSDLGGTTAAAAGLCDCLPLPARLRIAGVQVRGAEREEEEGEGEREGQAVEMEGPRKKRAKIAP